ncbi:hypothetical protein HDU67_009237 [Dinochytrium kinnereticum]|nr:hypothetical protein HDU67_009237 [Dinochytrium kinnereticum]
MSANGKPRRDPMVAKCCGCVSLRSGVMTLSILNLVSFAFGLGQIIYNKVAIDKVRDNELVNSILYGSLAYYCIVGTFEVIGLYGAIKNKLSLVKLYAIWSWIAVIVYSGTNVLFFRASSMADMEIILYSIIALGFLLQLYFCICIWSYYMELRDFPERYGLESAIKLQVIVTEVPPVIGDVAYLQPGEQGPKAKN